MADFPIKTWHNVGEPEANDSNSIINATNMNDLENRINNGFTSIDEKIQDSGWINIPLKQEVTAYIDTPKYRKIGKVVYITGRIKGITAINQIFATLPVGYRPKSLANFTCTGTGALTWRLYVSTDGSMGVGGHSLSNYNADYWYAIDCIFIAD